MAKTSKPETNRKPWIRPAVQKIAAGQAENGTRQTSSDASFSVS